jgi:hypothetical protein
MTKEQHSWLGYLATTLIGFLFLAAIAARSEFIEYDNQQAVKRAQSSVVDQETAFDTAQLFCAELPPSQRANCFQEFKRDHVAEVRAQADLAAQQDMAVWSFGVLLVSLFGLFFSAGGFVALVWTFRETRKMTQAQDRAYLVIGTARIFLDPTYGLTYGLEVRNSGNTPATFVTANLSLSITYPDPSDRMVARKDAYTIGDALNEVPAKAVGHMHSGHIAAILSLPEGLLASHGSHYRKTGTIIGTGDTEEDGIDARLDVVGTVSYFDVFGGEHKLQVRQYSMSLEDDAWTLRDKSSFVEFIRSVP